MAIRKRMKSAVKGLVKQSARSILNVVDAASTGSDEGLTSREVGLDVVVAAADVPVEPQPADELTPSTAPSAPVSSAPSLLSEESDTRDQTSVAASSEAADAGPNEAAPAENEDEIDESLLPVLNDDQRETVRESVVEMIQTVHDPEIPVNIYELGLIYDIDVSDRGRVDVRMTLTSPNCPAAQVLPGEVETKSRTVENVSSVSVAVVWDPPWEPSMMSEAAQLELNMF